MIILKGKDDMNSYDVDVDFDEDIDIDDIDLEYDGTMGTIEENVSIKDARDYGVYIDLDY